MYESKLTDMDWDLLENFTMELLKIITTKYKRIYVLAELMGGNL